MVQGDFGGALDTPRTNIGDATYLSRQPDFADISQEASFQSPGKDGNLVQQLRNGRSNGISLRTPRQRGPLADRRNLPPSVGGAEFTPLLKSATRNSVRRFGKENGNNNATAFNSPALDKIDESDMTPIPRMDASMYTGSRNQSYMDNTLPQVDTSSTASTPLALPPRRGGDNGPLQDGNQLSLREQENVIDRIEKENFGLKLKIHFLEEALRKAGPGFSEAALKENTELKVDKVTMQRELHKYKKHLTTAERDLESYRQQMLELQEKARRKYADENLRTEMEKLRELLDERDADIEDLQRQLDQKQRDNGQAEKLQDDIVDLEADLRDKDRQITEREDELEDLKDKLEELKDKLEEEQENSKDKQRKMVEMEEKAQASSEHNEELDQAKDTISDLEENIQELKQQLETAVAEKEKAEDDLEELQDEMVNKSVVTKGLSRQTEEKLTRLQSDLDQAGQDYAELEKELSAANQENEELQSSVKDLQSSQDQFDEERQSMESKIKGLEADLEASSDAKNLLQSRHDALSQESASLQDDIARLEKDIHKLEQSLQEEREHALGIEKDLRAQYQDEIQRLNDEVSDLQAEIREKDNLYDNDSEKWETEKHNLESERSRAEEKAAGLQRTIDRLQEAEGTLSDKKSILQKAMDSEAERHKSEEGVLTRQINDLQDALETRQTLLTNLRSELSTVRDELRQTQIDYQTQLNKVGALEDEVDVLQTTLDDEQGSGRQELESARRECSRLREQVSLLQKAQGASSDYQLNASRRECEDLREQLNFMQQRLDTAQAASSTSALQSTESGSRLQWQLTDAQSQLEKVSKEKQAQQDQATKINLELHSVRSSLAEVRAERDELEGELRRAKMYDNETLRVDQERLDLRTAKLKLDNEVRRLKDENTALADQREAVEKTLEEEIEKAAVEEERLGQEIHQLQVKLRQQSSAESYDLSAARRTIRELERRIEDYEGQILAAQIPGVSEGASELSLIRKDLSAARQKEIDFLQREADSKDTVKGLKRQVADLERQVHETEVSRLITTSPRSLASDSGRKSEVRELRHQLSSAQQSVHDLRSKNRETERHAMQAMQDLRRQLSDLEDQKVVLEEVLEEARQKAEETAAQHERTLRRMQLKLEKAGREAEASKQQQSSANAGGGGNSKHDREMLRKSRAEMENLEHDVRQQQDIIDTLNASEASLRRKLERARSERAAFRISAERLQRDLDRLRTRTAGAGAGSALANGTDQALETLVRAAEGAEVRHKKELRGMVMQMEWMQARWQREASLRGDAAYAKKFLQLQLDLANACNKAQLRELEDIRTNLLGNRKPLALPSATSGDNGSSSTTRPSLRTFLAMARFIARMRLSARDWAKHEAVRQRLVVATEEKRKEKRSRQLKVVRVDA